MDIDSAIALLQRVRDADGHGRRSLCVVLHKPGSLGGTPCVPVSSLHGGINFDVGRVLLSVDAMLTDLTSDQVEAITTSARLGLSWHAYQDLKADCLDWKKAEKPRVRAEALHGQICTDTQRWLRSIGCGVTAIEISTAAVEKPDVIGWRQGRSIVCEIKVSRSDFLADLKKPWRQVPATGMGDWRFYVAPTGLLQPDEMPVGWGLLEWDGRSLQRRFGVPKGNTWPEPPLEGNKHNETLVLCSLVRRLENPGSDRRQKGKGLGLSAEQQRSERLELRCDRTLPLGE